MLSELEDRIRKIIKGQSYTNSGDMKDCIDSLLALPPSPQQLDLIERLLVGEIVPGAELTSGEDLAFVEYGGWWRMAV
jgi:hypothetical protein